MLHAARSRADAAGDIDWPVSVDSTGETWPTHPTSWTSHQPKSAVCWQLTPAAILQAATTR